LPIVEIADRPGIELRPITPTISETKESPFTLNKPVLLPHYLVSPLPNPDGETIHMITIVLRASGDKTRDVLRMRRLHGTIMSFPGNDRFAFHVFERGRGYLLEFPNFTTRYCPEIISKLTLLVGPENVRIEPVTFQ
jgi:hypothetical protein